MVYINNIIIFLKNINNYLRYLDIALELLKEFRIILSLPKYYFAQLSILVLEHYISYLDLNTLKDKIKAI